MQFFQRLSNRINKDDVLAPLERIIRIEETAWVGGILLQRRWQDMSLVAALEKWEWDYLNEDNRWLLERYIRCDPDILMPLLESELDQSGAPSKQTVFSLIEAAPAYFEPHYRRWKRYICIHQVILKLLSELAVPYELGNGEQLPEILEQALWSMRQTSTLTWVDGAEADRLAEAMPPAQPVGHELWDQLVGPIAPGWFIVVGARTSVGKTALLLDLALRSGKHVAYISTEMSAEALANRVRAWGLRLRPQVKFLVIPETNVNRLLDGVPDDAEIVMIDYLQHLRANGYRSRWEEIGAITRTIKLWALERQIPVIAAAQLSRMAEQREPSLADLRESGSIEQDADVVLLLHREMEESYWVAAKHRYAATGKLVVKWDTEKARWETVPQAEPEHRWWR